MKKYIEFILKAENPHFQKELLEYFTQYEVRKATKYTRDDEGIMHQTDIVIYTTPYKNLEPFLKTNTIAIEDIFER